MSLNLLYTIPFKCYSEFSISIMRETNCLFIGLTLTVLAVTELFKFTQILLFFNFVSCLFPRSKTGLVRSSLKKHVHCALYCCLSIFPDTTSQVLVIVLYVTYTILHSSRSSSVSHLWICLLILKTACGKSCWWDQQHGIFYQLLNLLSLVVSLLPSIGLTTYLNFSLL